MSGEGALLTTRRSPPGADVPGEWVCRHRAQPNSSHIPPLHGYLGAPVAFGKGAVGGETLPAAAAGARFLLLLISFSGTQWILTPLLSTFQNFAIRLMLIRPPIPAPAGGGSSWGRRGVRLRVCWLPGGCDRRSESATGEFWSASSPPRQHLIAASRLAPPARRPAAPGLDRRSRPSRPARAASAVTVCSCRRHYS
jgi:hypothetical protein